MAEPPPKELGDLPPKRSKLVWRVLLITNLALAAYIFTRPKNKDSGTENHKKASKREVKESKPVEGAPVLPVELFPEPIFEDIPAKILEPIPEEQQREIFKWMLEEKRKAKPVDRKEKKRIDEDKACLKQFIGAKSIPDF